MELMLNHTRAFEKLVEFGRYLTRRTDSALVTPNTPRLRLGVFGVTRGISGQIPLFSQTPSCDFTYNMGQIHRWQHLEARNVQKVGKCLLLLCPDGSR